LPDVLGSNLKVVFCGTAAGRKSAFLKAYYAGPGNRFWEMIAKTGLTPRQLRPAEYESVLDFEIGLTDISKTAFGSDGSLKKADFSVNLLRAKLRRYKPKVIAFKSKKAGAVFFGTKVDYGLQPNLVESSSAFVLPSPSAAAKRHWDSRIWFDLARFLQS
jgi:TDG/mug DNA glycosylase family protein